MSGPDPKKRRKKPRVKSFLQQASAIIASEKGLNLAAQQKLQNLAEHLKMPQDELHEALALLQENEKLPEGLNRYEKKFIEFLRLEFKQISSGIITIAMENKAVDLAARKYDILEPRARKLIHQQAEAMGIGRISKSDAESYVEQLIVSRIGDASRVEELARERFYDIAKKWGVDAEQVDAVVLQTLAQNRKLESAEHGSARAPWVTGAVFCLLLGAGIVLAINAKGWLKDDRVSGDPDPKEEVIAPADDNLVLPDWWEEQGIVQIVEGLQQTKMDLHWVRDLASADAGRQVKGMGELWSLVKKQRGDARQPLSNFLARYYFACPSGGATDLVLQQLSRDLRVPVSRLPAKTERMKECYVANGMLGQLRFFQPANSIGEFQHRKDQVHTMISNEFGDVASDEGLAGYLAATDRVIAANQWNHLIQTSWASPKRTSLLIGALYDLTETRLDSQELHRFHRRTLMSVLESNQALWTELKSEILRAIEDSPKDVLNTWINHYQTAFDESYQEWLGLQLVSKCQLSLVSPSRIEVAGALQRFKSGRRREQFRELLDRNDKLDLLDQELRIRVQSSVASPQMIADVARAVTLSMSLSPVDQSSFSFEQFDFLYRKGAPNLATMARRSLSADPGFSAGDPTRSEILKKDEAFARLKSLQKDRQESRFASLKRLAEVSAKFDDITYQEASVLASFFLEISSDRERVQVIKLLPEFVSWPTFGLAISDQISEASTTLDNALTIARFYGDEGFELKEVTFWREEIRKFLFDSAITKIEQAKVKITEASQRWYFLRVDYAQLCELRLRALGANGFVTDRDNPVSLTRQMIRILLEQSPDSIEYPVDRAIEVLQAQSASELEELIALNRMLVKLLAQQVASRWPDCANDAKAVLDGLNIDLQATSGDMFLTTEWALLELWSLERRSIAKRLLTR